MTDTNNETPRLNEPKAIDYMPLFVPVTKQEVTQFKRDARKRGAGAGKIGFWIFFAVFAVAWLAIMMTATSSFGGGRGGFSMFVPVVIIGGFVALLIAIARGAGGGRWEKLLRSHRFASANGLIYVERITTPRYPGAIFGLGESRHAFGVYRRAFAPELELGSYRYTTGSGKNKSTHTWGYTAIRLPRKLPNMLLDAKGNNVLFGSNLPVSYRRDQVLSLEGDFNKYFTLYCPKQYERDALYVFTPDLMALLIDESAAFDVEIVDDWMFLYRNGVLDTTDAAQLKRIFTIVDTVGTKAQRQTRRYADERVGDPSVDYVTPQGQRLKRGVNWTVFIGVAIAVVWMVFNFASRGFFG